jgi:septum formation protein
MVILASESPRRRELLASICKEFEICSADIEEMSEGADLFLLPELNAKLKAAAVAGKNPDHLVIGADTAIIFGNEFIGKPADIEDAVKLLTRFSGRKHCVITGVAVIRQGADPIEISYHEVSEIKFKEIDRKTIGEYLRLVNVLDKAGAYAIQEHGSMIIDSYTGELENIIGLPLKRLSEIISKNNAG